VKAAPYGAATKEVELKGVLSKICFFVVKHIKLQYAKLLTLCVDIIGLHGLFLAEKY
jgi:hypothetical protein